MLRPRFVLLTLALGLSVVVLSAAGAAEAGKAVAGGKDANTRFVGDLRLGGQFNYLGSELGARAGYQVGLYDHKSPVLRNNFVRLGARLRMTPAGFHAGGFLLIQPASVFNFGMVYRYVQEFPTFGSGTVFKNRAALDAVFDGVSSYSDGEKRLNAHRDQVIETNGKRPISSGHLFGFNGTLKFKLKGVVAVLSAEMHWYRLGFSDKDNSELRYDALLDLVLQKHDLVVTVNGVLGYELGRWLLVVSTAYYHAVEADTKCLIVGPGARWTFSDRLLFLKKPFAMLLARWHASHMWRTGAIPRITIALGGNL